MNLSGEDWLTPGTATGPALLCGTAAGHCPMPVTLSRSAPGLCSPGEQPSPAAPWRFNVFVGKHNAENRGNAGEDVSSSC